MTNDPRENLLSEAVRLNDIKFYRLILLCIIFIFILILTSTLSLWCGRNLRIRLPTECPRYKALLLRPCPCSISNSSLCTAASSCDSPSSMRSPSCRKVVAVTVLSQVSPMAISCEPYGVCGSQLRTLRTRVAVWPKSKDKTVSCESN